MIGWRILAAAGRPKGIGRCTWLLLLRPFALQAPASPSATAALLRDAPRRRLPAPAPGEQHASAAACGGPGSGTEARPAAREWHGGPLVGSACAHVTTLHGRHANRWAVHVASTGTLCVRGVPRIEPQAPSAPSGTIVAAPAHDGRQLPEVGHRIWGSTGSALASTTGARRIGNALAGRQRGGSRAAALGAAAVAGAAAATVFCLPCAQTSAARLWTVEVLAPGGDGLAFPEELRGALEGLGLRLEPEQLAALAARLGPDRSGKVGLKELEKAMRQAERQSAAATSPKPVGAQKPPRVALKKEDKEEFRQENLRPLQAAVPGRGARRARARGLGRERGHRRGRAGAAVGDSGPEP
ncbi:unnamed protein product [Prorocentrum cordatum]|uniref:EF-hand domain-containing protein n=1 Tax=Prorocentrum cordatum TaxID=2364126 RepID=A0ABN9VFQ0_9DINO|nr:unnamed protein product [Polarella glacialis]